MSMANGMVLELKGDAGIARLGPRLGLDGGIGREGTTLEHGQFDRRGIEGRLGTITELDL
jgi:hypothetical protein